MSKFIPLLATIAAVVGFIGSMPVIVGYIEWLSNYSWAPTALAVLGILALIVLAFNRQKSDAQTQQSLRFAREEIDELRTQVANLPNEPLIRYNEWIERETRPTIGAHYSDDRIPIDGRRFSDCSFTRCTLTYSAHGCAGLISDDCRVDEETQLRYELNAYRQTIAYLRANAWMRENARLL